MSEIQGGSPPGKLSCIVKSFPYLLYLYAYIQASASNVLGLTGSVGLLHLLVP